MSMEEANNHLFWTFIVGVAGVVVFYWFLKLFIFDPIKHKKLNIPQGGPLNCQYCNHMVAPHVAYLGQDFTCPNCHAPSKAPNHIGSDGGDSSKIFVNILAAVFYIAIGAWVLYSVL